MKPPRWARNMHKDEAGFMALTTGGNAPVLALFEPSHMKYEADRTNETVGCGDDRSGDHRAGQNPAGYYLEIERPGRPRQPRRQRLSHGDRRQGLRRRRRQALEMTDPAETLIIVTADHEHAIAFNGYCGRGTGNHGLCMDIDPAGEKHLDAPVLGDDGKPYGVIGFLNGPGSVLKKR